MTTVNENDLEKSIGEKMKEFEKLKQEYAEQSHFSFSSNILMN